MRHKRSCTQLSSSAQTEGNQDVHNNEEETNNFNLTYFIQKRKEQYFNNAPGVDQNNFSDISDDMDFNNNYDPIEDNDYYEFTEQL